MSDDEAFNLSLMARVEGLSGAAIVREALNERFERLIADPSYCERVQQLHEQETAALERARRDPESEPNWTTLDT